MSLIIFGETFELLKLLVKFWVIQTLMFLFEFEFGARMKTDIRVTFPTLWRHVPLHSAELNYVQISEL